MNEEYEKLEIAEKGARLSIAAYIFLSIFKLSMGYFFNSKALLADGINNSTDIIASVAIFIGLKISRKPADEDHAYGHLRAQTVSSLVASIIMAAVGIDVLYNAIHSTIYFREESPDMITAGVASACAVIIYFVYRYNRNIALKINSLSLMAAAKDNLSDSWVSIGAAIGITASQFGYPWIDPLAAAVVGILIIKTGIEIFKESANNLTDGFDSRKLDNIVYKIESTEGVESVKNIKARVHGNNILLDIIIGVNSRLTVSESHKITEKIEKKLNEECGIEYVIIHVEPSFTI